MWSPGELVDALVRAGAGRGSAIGLAAAPGVGVGLALAGAEPFACAGDPAPLVGAVEDALRPRWVTWSPATARTLVRAGVRLATCWDVLAVHRLLVGGWRADPAHVWAWLHDLPADTVPGDAAARPVPPGHRRRRRGCRGAGPRRRSPAPGLGRRRLGDDARADGPLGAARARWRPTSRPGASTDAPAAGRAVGHGTLGVDGRAAVRRAGGRRPADGPRRGRGAHRRVRRAPAAQRAGGRRAACRARRRGAAPRPAGQPVRPAQPGRRAVAAAAHRRRGARHPGLAARGAPRRAPADRRRCSPGARPSGWRRRSATPGSTSTSAPTVGCAASGPAPTAPPGG